MKEIVLSVPHSGTRTLMAELGVDHYEHFAPGRCDLMSGNFRAHVPMRNPMDVAESWAGRGKGPAGVERLVSVYGFMFDWLDRNRTAGMYRVEDFGRREGSGEVVVVPSREDQLAYQDAVYRRVVIPHRVFWAMWYGEQLAL